MVGVFDSGRGGELTLRELRRLEPRIDIAFYADRENAPYGTKTEGELISLVGKDIEKLLNAGAERILMACCTASTVYDLLPEKYKRAAIPIIEPCAALAVSLTRRGKIGVLSTEATRRSEAFPRAIGRIDPRIVTVCVSAPELVLLSERGACDGRLTKKDRDIIKKVLLPFEDSGIDALILGCTHFAAFENELEDMLGVNTVNSARVGAAVLSASVSEEGEGRTVYIGDARA